MYVVVSPAYGRDYDQPGDASKDWFDGKDFVLQSLYLGFGGKYCSVRDFKPDDQIEIRFNKMQDLVIVTNGRTDGV